MSKSGKIALLSLFLASAVALSACTSMNHAVLTSTAEAEEAAAAIDDSMYTKRDLAGSWEEDKAVTVTLNGTSASATSDTVQIDGSTVTITDEGVYVLSGTLNGMIIVDAEEGDKVQLVLNGVSVASPTSAAVYVRQADKLFLTLADGTLNSLSNGGTFTAIDDVNIDAAVFARCDMTINGTGSLTVTSSAGHGIVSKDDLVIAGGSVEVTRDPKGFQAKTASGSQMVRSQ